MTTEKDFWEEEKRINALDFSLFADPCAALDAAQPFEGESNYWELAFYVLREHAAFRILEAGLNPENFGLRPGIDY
jgi:hypothetical protein